MVQLLVMGDMVGDRIVVGEYHLICSECAYSRIKDSWEPKMVVAVAGPSGSGKSEIASLIGTYFTQDGHPSYVLSCDNYVHLPPRYNDQHRKELHEQGGRSALECFLGTQSETNLARLSSIVNTFRAGQKLISLRYMDASNNRIYGEQDVDFSDIDVLVLEGTWSNSVDGASLRIFLDIPVHVTLEHRRKRGRDPLGPFGEMVLQIEEAKLQQLRSKADFVVQPKLPLEQGGGDAMTPRCCNSECPVRNQNLLEGKGKKYAVL